MATTLPSTGNSFGGTLTGVANLASIFLGNTTNTNQTGTTTDNRSAVTTNSGGTTVTTNEQSVAPGAVDALIKSILEGTNGLAAVATGQKQAGLYNSTTNKLLVNDLAARAAAEGAKLNQKTTQTTVTPQTTQTVNNSGGTTTSQNQTAVKQAPISAGIGIGALTALQLIPKDTKDSFFKSLSGLSGTAAKGSEDLASIISGTGDFSRLDRANDAAATATDGLPVARGFGGAEVSNIAAPEASSVSGFADFSSVMSDVADPIESAGAISDGVSGFTDFVSGLSDLDFSNSFDSVLSTAAAAGVDAFDFLGFADGGMVDVKNLPQTQSEYDARNGERLAALMSAKPAFKPKGYADGGAVKPGATPKSYLPNTGLRSKIPALLQAGNPDSNNQELSSLISRAASSSARISAPTAVRSAGNSASVAGRNSSSGEISYGSPSEGASAEAVEGTGIGEISGIANAIGISPGQAKAGLSGLGIATGTNLGGLGGLATARNNDEAVAGIGKLGASMLSSAVLGPVGPAIVAAYSIIDSLVGGSKSAGQGNTDPFGGMSVAGAYGPQSSTADLQSLNSSIDLSQAALDGMGGNSSDGNDGTGAEGGGIGGSGNSAGDGEGGDTASAANGGKISGPGTGTSDSIPAKLSDGEYVIPADVVEALGVGFFDNLRAKFHTPVAMQRGK